MAEAAPRLQRVFEMQRPVVRLLMGDRSGDRHLRHDRGTTAADQALVEQEHRPPLACRGDRRIHAGPSRPDDKHVRGQMRHGSSSPSPRGAFGEAGADNSSCDCHHARNSTSRSTM